MTAPGAARAAAVDLADELCALSPFGVVMTKEVMWANLAAPSLEVAVHLENRTQILAARSGEKLEPLLLIGPPATVRVSG